MCHSDEMYEESVSIMVNATASAVKHVIDVLDADVSDLDPNVIAVTAVCIPLILVASVVFCTWYEKCKCCCFCCFGRRLIPNTDAKDNIIGDEDFDPEAVHTDPEPHTSASGTVSPKSSTRDDVDDGAVPTSPPVTESSDDEERETGEAAYEKDSKACCNAVASCLQKDTSEVAKNLD